MDHYNKDTPLISVVIPAYNSQSYINKAIDSVLEQSYSHFEIIVVNDGSNDATKQVVDEYSDPRIHLISQSNGGMSKARNAGINLAKGEFIAFLDADDYWLAKKLEKQLDFLIENPDLGFCSTRTRVETPDGQFVNEWNCPHLRSSTLHTIFSENSAIAGSASSVMTRATLQKQAGLFDENLKGLEDTDMWIRFAAHAEYRCIDEILTVVLKRPNSVSRDLTNMRNSALLVWKKNKHLLDKKLQKHFWGKTYSTILCDFAKWEARSGLKRQAIFHLMQAFFHAPLSKGRLSLSLLIAVLFNQSLD